MLPKTGLMQDDSRDLSRWLSGRVGAWSLAREAAERARDERLPVCADRDLVKEEGERSNGA